MTFVSEKITKPLKNPKKVKKVGIHLTKIGINSISKCKKCIGFEYKEFAQ